MRTWAKGTSRAALLTASFVALGVSAIPSPSAFADTTSGESGVLGGNQANLPVSAPVNACGNALGLLGKAKAGCEGGATVDNGGGGQKTSGKHGETSGKHGVAAGNQLNAPISAPVNACGNAIAILGDAKAGCDGGANVGPGGKHGHGGKHGKPAGKHGKHGGKEGGSGGQLTDGTSGVLAGNQANAPISAPVNVCGNAAAVLGKAVAGCDGGASVKNGGHTGGSQSTSGTSSVGGGNQANAPISIPIDVCGNAVGNAAAHCEGGATVRNGGHGTGGQTTNGDHGVLGGNQGNAPITAPIEVCGNAAALLGEAGAKCEGGTHVRSSSGGGQQTSGTSGVGAGNQANAPAKAPVDVCGNVAAVLGLPKPQCDDGPKWGGVTSFTRTADRNGGTGGKGGVGDVGGPNVLGATDGLGAANGLGLPELPGTLPMNPSAVYPGLPQLPVDAPAPRPLSPKGDANERQTVPADALVAGKGLPGVPGVDGLRAGEGIPGANGLGGGDGLPVVTGLPDTGGLTSGNTLPNVNGLLGKGSGKGNGNGNGNSDGKGKGNADGKGNGNGAGKGKGKGKDGGQGKGKGSGKGDVARGNGNGALSDGATGVLPGLPAESLAPRTLTDRLPELGDVSGVSDGTGLPDASALLSMPPQIPGVSSAPALPVNPVVPVPASEMGSASHTRTVSNAGTASTSPLSGVELPTTGIPGGDLAKNGIPGTQSITGKKGLPSPKSLTDTKGIAGLKDVRGLAGLKGAKGTKGSTKGVNGVDSLKGAKGVNGLKGAEGLRGLPAANGLPVSNLPTGNLSTRNLPVKGLPINGLPIKGLPINGLPVNGLPTGSLPVSGLPASGKREVGAASLVDGVPAAGSVAGVLPSAEGLVGGKGVTSLPLPVSTKVKAPEIGGVTDHASPLGKITGQADGVKPGEPVRMAPMAADEPMVNATKAGSFWVLAMASMFAVASGALAVTRRFRLGRR